MPTYAFKGRNRLNELVSGEKEAASQDELRNLLRREQIVMTQASEKGREISIPKLGRGRKVKAKELAVFTRQFSVMIDAGLPLVSCIDILAQQQQNYRHRQPNLNAMHAWRLRIAQLGLIARKVSHRAGAVSANQI